MKNHLDHMCVNSNTCDICQGLVSLSEEYAVNVEVLGITEEDKRKVVGKHCGKCYRSMEPAERVCMKCNSTDITLEYADDDPGAVRAESSLCIKHPDLRKQILACPL